MAVPKNPEPTPVKDGDVLPAATWPGPDAVPGQGENPLMDTPGAPASPGRDKTGNKSGEPDPSQQTASLGPEGAPQPVPREDDPGINANVVS